MAPTGSRNSVKPSSPPGTDAPSTPTPSVRGSSSPAGKASQKGGAGVNWWPGSRASKAAPVTEVARESISAANNAAPNVVSSPTSHPDDLSKQRRNPSLQLTSRAGASSRSLPVNATTTRINIASDGSSSSANTASESINKEHPTDKGDNNIVDGAGKDQPESAVETATSNAGDESGEPESKQEPTTQSGGWISWLYNSVPMGKSFSKDSELGKTATEPPTVGKDSKDTTQADPDHQVVEEQDQPKTDTPEITEVHTAPQRLSWFQMWYGSPYSSKGSKEPKKEQEPAKDPPQSTLVESADATFPATRQATPVPSERSEGASEPPNTPSQNPRSSGWSFWFRDTSKDSTQTNSQNADAVEASIKPDSSSHQPKREQSSEPEQDVEVKTKGNVKIKPPKDSPGPAVVPDRVSAQLEISPNAPPPKAPEDSAARNLQRILPNQVLPHFQDTFTLQEAPSLLQSIGRRLLHNNGQSNKHVYRIRDPPRIRKALAIGVHGYFPAPLIRSVLGQPTGTSIRFSNMAADAIKKWTENHGYTCDVGRIALEGEGRIAERVDLLWKLLLNWMEEIRKADYIMIACHSQGVPVSVMLVAKLISFGCVNASRVGICAMAGVNLGPFPDYKSRWISGSAAELFEFALPYSQVSKDYEAALRCALDFGVRISYVGSIDDQLVSLESSLFSPINHPYIYRAAFVDSRVHAASFISHLIGFALKLRNLGFADHGLIRELSSPLAGSLYTGEGHSRLYDDESVYSLAISFALETSDVSGATLQVKRPAASLTANPYILPFAMRGLLEEEYVKRELYDETMELLKQFDEWKPSSKVLKDVKFRLEGIRSKL